MTEFKLLATIHSSMEEMRASIIDDYALDIKNRTQVCSVQGTDLIDAIYKFSETKEFNDYYNLYKHATVLEYRK